MFLKHLKHKVFFFVFLLILRLEHQGLDQKNQKSTGILTVSVVNLVYRPNTQQILMLTTNTLLVMKKSLLLILGVAAMLLVVSCQKTRTSTPVQSVSVRTDVSKIVYSASGDTDALTLDATADWTAVSQSEWLTVSPERGSRGVCEVIVTIAANSGEPRTGYLMFTSGKHVEKIEINQAGN